MVNGARERYVVRMQLTTQEPRTRTYTYLPPFTDFERVAHLDGLALLKRMIANEFPAPPITATLGFALVEAERGRAAFSGQTAEWLYNPIGVVHGGWAATLLDSALGCAVHTTLAAGDTYTTLDLQVRFVRAVVATTGTVRAEATAVHAGRRVATAEARLTDAEGRLLATATTSCLIQRIG
jgi:uncharacterized protein (TIGR00369 family)